MAIARSSMVDRAFAALAGGAPGDAMGMPTQLLSRQQISERYGVVEDFPAPSDDHPVSKGLAAGTITDDTEQTMLLGHVLLKSAGGFDHRLWIDALVLWEEDIRTRGGYDLLGPSTSVTDWKALGIIERSGPLTHRDLVDLIGLKPASVTNILDRLESRQWISRVKADDDARRISISVNEQKISAYRQRIFGSLMNRLNGIYKQYSTQELIIIADALEKVAQAQAAATDDIPQV